MKLMMIAAIGKNRELGLQGDMPWKRALKQDLTFFRDTTKGHAMVITTSEMKPQENLEVFHSIDAFLQTYQDTDQTIFVIGGGSIYQQMLDACAGMYLTLIDCEFEADTWFPQWDCDQFTSTCLGHVEENGYSYSHVLFTRKEA